MKTYRAGVIGQTGRGDYGHGLDEVYLKMDDVEIVAIADDNPEGLKEAGKRLGVSNLYADYRDMLSTEQFDIVSVSPTWVEPHLPMLLAVAQAGACVFLEKPMARTLAETDAMIEACERAGVTIGIAHQGLIYSASHHAKQLIKEGIIGTVLSAQMRGKEDTRGGGEDLMMHGTHMFAALRFLIDTNPEWVFAHVSMDDGRPVTKTDAVEGPQKMGLIAGDHVHALYGFKNGITATFESRRNQSHSKGRLGLQIFGTKGIMSASHNSHKVHMYGAPFWRPDISAPVRDVPAKIIEALPEDQRRTLRDFRRVANAEIVRDVLQAREEGRQSVSSGHDGRWAMEMIHGVYESHLQGRRVELPLTNRENPLS